MKQCEICNSFLCSKCDLHLLNQSTDYLRKTENAHGEEYSVLKFCTCDSMAGQHKDYLGDSVYAAVDQNGSVVLTTENGFGSSNTILMEDFVIEAFLNYIQRVKGIKRKD